LNGKAAPVPEHGDESPFCRLSRFSIGKGFVVGTNALEIDVYNGCPSSQADQVGHGPMGLRIQLSGSVLSRHSGDHGQPRRKEGRPMK